MSRFFSKKHSALTPYTPGEQPKDRRYIKLNTNESPYPPSENVIKAAEKAAGSLNLYSDPEMTELCRTAAEYFSVSPDMLLMTNGSDEILNFAFMAFGDEEHPFVFPELTYGFYPVFAQLNHVPYKTIPLQKDFSIDVSAYENVGANIVIANPNAPTGMYLDPEQIRRIVSTNPDSVVVIDEAYIDFGGESVLPLTKKYGNLLVTRTFSKSYSLAGARLGFGVGSPELIRDLNTVKYSTNPYNVNSMTAAAGIAAIRDSDYYMSNCRRIISTREKTKSALLRLGFEVTDSKTNFLFISHEKISGGELYRRMRENGILIRYFGGEHNRVTIGSEGEMERFIEVLRGILG